MLPQGDATHLSWVMRGPAPFISIVDAGVSLILDRMIGKDFEIGLANLKKPHREVSRNLDSIDPTKEQAMQINPYLFYESNCESGVQVLPRRCWAARSRCC